MEFSGVGFYTKPEDILNLNEEEPRIVNLCRQSISEYHLCPITPDIPSSGGSEGSSRASSSRASPVQFSAAPLPKTADILTPVVVEMTRKCVNSQKPTQSVFTGKGLTPRIRVENVDELQLPVVEGEDEEIQDLTVNIQERMEIYDKGRIANPKRFTPDSDNSESQTFECVNQNGSQSVTLTTLEEIDDITGRGVFQTNYSSLSTSPSQSTNSPKAMTSTRSKSPRPVTPKKEDESFWDKIGTLGRKKRIKEVQDFEQEGKNAIDSPGSPTQFDIPPEDYDLAEGEERSLIERRSLADPKLQHLIGLLIDWINDELADQRIIVKSIDDDLYDGQILQKLLEKLTGQKLEVPEVSQSEEGQRHKLQLVLNEATQVVGLPRWTNQKWSVESIHSKSLVSILYLLVTLARHFRAPLRLPENVNVEIVVVKKRNGKLEYRRVVEEITSRYDEFGMKCERDAFDTLLTHASDKLPVVKKSLISFVNKHLNKINLEVTDIDNQFHDGVYLILLMGLLEGYFVPLFEFHLTPKNFEQKVFNVSFAFELIQDAGISKPKARPEDIVNLDLKSTLRVLYNLFAKYKNLN